MTPLPSGIRTRNPSKQAAAGRTTTGIGFIEYLNIYTEIRSVASCLISDLR